ncbi:MAG: DUF6644 family protein [Pacificimonas sp.]|jgi:hypothetical protein|nr:DUF6644 family protein [Pacificimonas sp.]
MTEWVTWLSDTAWSVALRESLYMWTILEATHVISLMLFAGLILMVDLRLLGIAFRDAPISEFERRVLPWVVAGFAIMLITGLVLFYAKPLTYWNNIFFRAKVAVLVLAIINIVWFHFRVQRNQATWDTAKRLPASVRASGVVSLVAWGSIIVLGRMIAYDWYDCVKLEGGGLLATLAQCPVAETAARVSLGGPI